MKSLGLLEGHSQVDEHRDVGGDGGGGEVSKGGGEVSVASSGLSSGTPSSKVTQ